LYYAAVDLISPSWLYLLLAAERSYEAGLIFLRPFYRGERQYGASVAAVSTYARSGARFAKPFNAARSLAAGGRGGADVGREGFQGIWDAGEGQLV
jgi:hypothetical protein